LRFIMLPAAKETNRTEPGVIRDVLQYFLDVWLEGERAKLERFRQMGRQMQVKGKRY
jgi:hypothetical protein